MKEYIIDDVADLTGIDWADTKHDIGAKKQPCDPFF